MFLIKNFQNNNILKFAKLFRFKCSQVFILRGSRKIEEPQIAVEPHDIFRIGKRFGRFTFNDLFTIVSKNSSITIRESFFFFSEHNQIICDLGTLVETSII